MNPSAEDADLKAGTTLELPLWLIQPLLERRQQVLSVDLPKVYTELYREIFKADATVIDMRKFGIYYYELGQYIKNLDTRGDVAESLINVNYTNHLPHYFLIHFILCRVLKHVLNI